MLFMRVYLRRAWRVVSIRAGADREATSPPRGALR